MSIATRPPGPDLASGSRAGDEPRVGISRPPTVLLPDGGNPAPAPALVPGRVLARDALRSIRFASALAAVPEWRLGDDLWAEVDVVRSQLAPIVSRRSLASSYQRESFQGTASAASAANVAPVRSYGAAARLAYAIRWQELGPDRG
jgi:hypothetical protein